MIQGNYCTVQSHFVAEAGIYGNILFVCIKLKTPPQKYRKKYDERLSI